jgi:hypothetical protein
MIEKKLESDEFSIPLNVTDFLEVCKIYANLGAYQTYIDQLAEDKQAIGIPVSIIPNLIEFFDSISNNPYFGEAASSAKDTSNILKNILKNYNKRLN